MRCINSILISLLFLPVFIKGQNHPKFTVAFGVGQSHFFNQEAKDDPNHWFDKGISTAFALNLYSTLGNKSYISYGVEYTSISGSEVHYGACVYPVTRNYHGNVVITETGNCFNELKLEYLSIPVLYNFQLGKFYSGLGLFPAFLLPNSSYNGVVKNEKGLYVNKNMQSEILKGFLMGISAELGTNVLVPFYLGLRYNVSSDVSNDEGSLLYGQFLFMLKVVVK